jgi:hypothetical protein
MKLLRNRWVRRVGVTIGVVLLLVVLAVVNTWFTLRNRGLEHRSRVLADLDATSPGWRIEQLQAARHIPEPERNIAEQAQRIRDRFPPGYRDWLMKQKNPFDVHVGHLPHPDELALARELVELCREHIVEARNLRHLHAGGTAVVINPNVIGTLLAHLDKIRAVATLLQHDALVSAVDTRGDDAIDDALAILALARGIGDEPFLVSQLVRIHLATMAARSTERTLGLCAPSEPKLAEVQAAFEAEAKVPRLLYGLKGERGAMNLLADNVESGAVSSADVIQFATDSKPPAAIAALPVRALLPEVQARYLELMNRAIATAEKPPGPARDDEFKAIEDDIKTEGDLAQKALRYVFPAVARCYDAEVRVTALLRASAAGVAAERHRLSTGTYPAAWGDGFDPPTDPYTPKPLLFEVTTDGMVVYSTGPDRTDDGGKLSSRQLVEKGFDFGFQQFTPEHRRRPPIPQPRQP